MSIKTKNIFLVIGILLMATALWLGIVNNSYAGTGKSGLVGETFELQLKLYEDIWSYLPADQVVAGKRIYMYCVQKHGQISQEGKGPFYTIVKEEDLTVGNNQMYAYILAETAENGGPSKVAQVAIWMAAELNHNASPYTPGQYNSHSIQGVEYEDVQVLVEEAREFQKYYNELQAGKLFEDKTDYENVKVAYDYSSSSYIAGPFKMDYIAKEINNKKFAYITKMLVKQYTPKGTVDTDVSFLKDKNSASTTNYPASGEEFFVKFKGVDGVYGFNLQVSMHYIKEYEGYLLYLDGYRIDENGVKVPQQDLIGVDAAYPNKIEDDATFEMKPPDGPPYISTTMKLGGYIWIDREQGKETLVNGYKDPGEEVLPGVIVTLYKNDETTPAVLEKDGKTSANPVTTDSTGYYEFDYLTSGDGDRYYVKFEYDGLNYQDTIFMAGQTGEKANADKEYGVSPWEKNSKGMEDLTQRENFNKTFAEIGSYPENYKSPTTGQANATFNRDNKDMNQVIQTAWSTMQGITKSNKNLTRESIKSAYENAAKGVEDGNKMVTFIMDSYVQLRTKHSYPYIDKYVIGDKDITVAGVTYKALYNGQLRVNQGFYLRPTGDLSLVKDVYNAEVTINGKQQTYEYNSRDALVDENGNSPYWEIEIRNSDAAYSQASYNRSVYGADYNYKASAYGTSQGIVGASAADELQVYVTYKIVMSNRSSTVDLSIDEVVDYYDKDYEVVEAYYGNRRNSSKTPTTFSTTSKYGSNTQFSNQASSEGLNVMYIPGPEGKLKPGETAYLYVKYKVVKENGYIKLDDDGSYKANIAEINGYSTWYSDGTSVPHDKEFINVGGKVAGVLDKNSTPGNLRTNFKRDVFEENDTDHAPKFFLTLGKDEREINGVVWDDERTQEIAAAMVGDGVYNGEQLINGVKVQLVEVKNGQQYVWNEVTTGTKNLKEILTDKTYTLKDGASYQFKGYVAGDYFVRFIYGDNYDTVLVKGANLVAGADGANNKSYNGQDFKSTTYQKGIENGYDPDAENSNETYGYNYDIAASEAQPNVSDAKDIASRRNEVEAYSNKGITNRIAEKLSVLAGKEPEYYSNITEYTGEKIANGLDNKAIIDEMIPLTRMWAETGKINVEIEKNRTTTVLGQSTDYQLAGIDFGIEERPKAQLAVDKQVSNIKVTLANGNVLFDANDSVTNLLWNKGEEHQAKYEGKKMLEPIVRGNSAAGDNGVIQATMDSELMHGAALQVTYSLKVRNIGEVDYKDNSFYYTGNVKNESSIVKTQATQIIEYVDSNLRYDEAKNNTEDWKLTSAEEVYKDELVGKPIENDVKSYDVILITEKMGDDLVPEIYGNGTAQVTKQLVLTQMLTSGNSEDDLEYNNTIEIVKSKNTVGRRMAYSIEGNQNPNGVLQEVDADKAETVRILPPFGDHKIYYVIAIAVAVVLLSGIVLIKKFVIKKK